MRDHPDAIDVAAARWVARLDRAPDDANLAGEIDRWCAEHPRHVGALLRARAVWSGLDAADARIVARPLFSRRRVLTVSGGLAVAAAAVGAVWLETHGSMGIETAVGERRLAKLEDGSTIVLNTASRTRVRMTPEQRSVALDDGEAWFAVATDHARPFVVSAGDVRVRAVGTAFAVRRYLGRAEVTVTEGRVRVWSVAAPERFVMLSAGKQASVADVSGTAETVVANAKPAESLAWRQGEIILDGMTFGDAAAEFNRYNTRQLSVDTQLADRRIVGWFRTDDLDGFARAAAIMTGAKIERDGADLRIVK
jgi:transmembrane sensor